MKGMDHELNHILVRSRDIIEENRIKEINKNSRLSILLMRNKKRRVNNTDAVNNSL